MTSSPGSDSSLGRSGRLKSALKIAFGVLSVLFVAAYPLTVWLGLSRLSVRHVAAILLAFLIPGAAVRIWKHRSQAKQLLGLSLSAVLLIGLAMAFNDERFMRAYPVIVSAVMLAQFSWTLKSPPPMVERFARMQTNDLNAAEITYCRSVTVIWSLFFAVNGAACAVLALFGPRSAWALYTGLISYVLMGLLFAGEFVVRKYRFRHHPPQNVLDRLAARIFPCRTPPADSVQQPNALSDSPEGHP